jgi:hypothetical protein
VVPSGLTFTPAASYVGVDVFKVRVSDGTAFDTITINVIVDSFPPPVISGIDTVCVGQIATLTASIPGGTWSHSNATTVVIGGATIGLIPGRDTIMYAVNNGCALVSAIFPFTVMHISHCIVGAEQLTTTGTITIFPNPSRGSFQVFVPSATQQSAQLFVTNMLGQKIAERIIRTNSDATIDLDVAPGIYMLDIVTEGARYNSKISITR